MTELKKELAVSEADQAGNESPLFVLKLRRKLYIPSFLLMNTGLLLAYFGVIIPVLKTGDYASAFFSAENVRISRKIILFYSCLYAAPIFTWLTFLSIWRVGDAYFYRDKLIVKALFSRRIIKIPYDEMHVIQKKTTLFITRHKIPHWSNFSQFIKVKYLEGVGFNTATFSVSKIFGIKESNGIWENLDEGPKAMQLLKERAFSYMEKN